AMQACRPPTRKRACGSLRVRCCRCCSRGRRSRWRPPSPVRRRRRSCEPAAKLPRGGREGGAGMDVSVELPYLINDADNHFVEPLDMYERYTDPKWRDKAMRFLTDDQGRKTQLFAGPPSKNALTRDSVPQNEEDLEAPLSSATPSFADEHAPKPGDGGARAPGMFLSRLNPYKDLTEAERKDLISKFKEQ